MYNVVIDYESCENNENCYEVCPEDVFEKHTTQIVVAKADSCSGCWLCVNNCPTGAVTIE